MKDTFLGSLVCNVTPGVRLLQLSSLGGALDCAAPQRLGHINVTNLGNFACEGHEVSVSQKSDKLDSRTEHRLSWAGELQPLRCTKLSPGPRVLEYMDRPDGRTHCLFSADAPSCLPKSWLPGAALFAAHYALW